MGLCIINRNVFIVGLIITLLIPNAFNCKSSLTLVNKVDSKTPEDQLAVGSKSDAINLLPNIETCGIQNSDRIYGGTRADVDEHPWIALLKYLLPKDGGWRFYCGGVLISSRYVLTAAHCVVKEKNATERWRNTRLTHARLGEWNLECSTNFTPADCSDPAIDVPIERIIPHEGYQPLGVQQYDDIALLRLARSVQFTDFIKPICLPLASDVRKADFLGYDAQVAGWGITEKGTRSANKLKVQIPIVNNERCNKVYNRRNKTISEKQICAGGEGGRDSCGNDSGSSLMARVPPADNWLAIGVVSYGPRPCGVRGWPAVHTRVGAYVDWILSKLEP